MRTEMSNLVVALASITLLLGGCATVKMGDPARSAELKKFEPKPELAQIYVCRNGRGMGVAVRPRIEIDDKPVGNIAVSTFAYTEVAPGKHKIVAKTPEHDSTIDFSVAAGERKFFQTWISAGVFIGWGIIDEMTSDDGMACVKDGQLVEGVAFNK